MSGIRQGSALITIDPSLSFLCFVSNDNAIQSGRQPKICQKQSFEVGFATL